MKFDFKKKREELIEQFKKLKAEKEMVIENGKVIEAELYRVQGEVRLIDELLEGEEKDELRSKDKS